MAPACAQLLVGMEPLASCSGYLPTANRIGCLGFESGPLLAGGHFKHGRPCNEGRRSRGQQAGAKKYSSWRAAADVRPRAPAEPAVIRVKAGDKLVSISQEHRTTVRELLRMNEHIRANPDRLAVGTEIRVPARGGAPLPEIVVKPGDKLLKISEELKTPVEDLVQLNKDTIKDPDHIMPDAHLKVPPVALPAVKIRRGDRLFSLSKEHQTTVEDLVLMNKDRITHPDRIYYNNPLRVPPTSPKLAAQSQGPWVGVVAAVSGNQSANTIEQRAGSASTQVTDSANRTIGQARTTTATSSNDINFLPRSVQDAYGGIFAGPRGLAVFVAGVALVLAGVSTLLKGGGRRDAVEGIEGAAARVRSSAAGAAGRVQEGAEVAQHEVARGAQGVASAAKDVTRPAVAKAEQAAGAVKDATRPAVASAEATADAAVAKAEGASNAVKDAWSQWIEQQDARVVRGAAPTETRKVEQPAARREEAVSGKPEPMKLQGKEHSNTAEEAVKTRIDTPTFSKDDVTVHPKTGAPDSTPYTRVALPPKKPEATAASPVSEPPRDFPPVAMPLAASAAQSLISSSSASSGRASTTQVGPPQAAATVAEPSRAFPPVAVPLSKSAAEELLNDGPPRSKHEPVRAPSAQEEDDEEDDEEEEEEKARKPWGGLWSRLRSRENKAEGEGTYGGAMATAAEAIAKEEPEFQEKDESLPSGPTVQEVARERGGWGGGGSNSFSFGSRSENGAPTSTTLSPSRSIVASSSSRNDSPEALQAARSLGADYESARGAFKGALEEAEENPAQGRESLTRAFKSAVPTLAVTAGAAGIASGLEGGLEMVGLISLASFITYDLLWAERREELWQQIKSIRNHKQLLYFLKNRDIIQCDELDEQR